MIWALVSVIGLPIMFGYFWNMIQERKWARASIKRQERNMTYRDFPSGNYGPRWNRWRGFL